MVENTDTMDRALHALANRARRGMVERLTDGPLTVGQLAAPLEMSLAAAAKHVQVLERAGLIYRVVEGRRHVCGLTPGALVPVRAWLERCDIAWSAGAEAQVDLSQLDQPEVRGRGGQRRQDAWNYLERVEGRVS